MPGRFAVLLHGQYPADVPPAVIAEALGFTGPEDVLVFVSKERLKPGESGPQMAQEEPGDLDGPLAYRGQNGHFVVRNNADVQSDQALKPGDEPLPEVVHEHEVHVHVPVPIGHRAALPASLEDIEQSRARAQQITDISARHLGIRLPADAKGVTFNDIQRVAAALRCTAELLPGFEVMLTGKFGSRYCKSFAIACQCLNQSSYSPEATHG